VTRNFAEYLEEVNKESVMATPDLERMLDDWAIAWSSNDSNDPERILALLPRTVFSRTLPLAWWLAAKRNFAASRTPLLRQSLTSNME
jgi:hypothetical protein